MGSDEVPLNKFGKLEPLDVSIVHIVSSPGIVVVTPFLHLQGVGCV